MKFQETAVGKFFKSDDYICYIIGINISDEEFKMILIDFRDEIDRISYAYFSFNEIFDDFEICTKEEFMCHYNSLISSFNDFLKLA